MLLGRATPEATARYAARHGTLKHAGFYRDTPLGSVSSLGIGTYLGEMTREADAAYTEAIVAAVRGGINFIDTSLNYRNQKSEQAIAQAILRLIETPKELDRDEFAICTKAGYLVRGAMPEQMRPEDVAGGMHSMAPAFLADQLDRSRVNLGLETIDVFYLHNPETQIGFLSQNEFYDRLRLAFRFLEEAVAAQKIHFYGAATWEGFRKPHALSLTKMEAIAREIGGAGHHFRFVQLPFNLAMPEAFTSRHEERNGAAATVLETAAELGITVVASASILQARLSRDLPGEFTASLPGLSSDAQRAIQFARSTPGITTALVGMGRAAHVEENLGLALVPPLTRDEYSHLFRIGP
jgi:aryl-alcohol dehydrogenase-like predicted oxidoreductase